MAERFGPVVFGKEKWKIVSLFPQGTVFFPGPPDNVTFYPFIFIFRALILARYDPKPPPRGGNIRAMIHARQKKSLGILAP